MPQWPGEVRVYVWKSISITFFRRIMVIFFNGEDSPSSPRTTPFPNYR